MYKIYVKNMITLITAFITCVLAADSPASALSAQRSELATQDELQNVLQKTNSNQVLRRDAFRKLLNSPDGFKVAVKYIDDPDSEIRIAAVYFLYTNKKPESAKILAKVTKDQDARVRYLAVLALSDSKSAEIKELLSQITLSDSDPHVRRIAKPQKASVSRKNILLKDDPTWDYDVVKIKTMDLYENNLKFKIDPVADGQSKGYQDVSLNDSTWDTLKVGPWQQQGFAKYKGEAWYRLRFVLPEKIDSNAVELLLPELSPNAWVWVNGIFVGEHDGEASKTTSLRLDITSEIKWGHDNLICIRVSDNSEASGILKPARIDIFK